MPNSVAPPSIDRLKAIPIFEGIDDGRLAQIAAMTTEFDAPAGQVLVAARHEASGVFILEEGRVVVRAGDAFIRELGPGELFGELAVINEGPRSATVISKTPIKCIAIGRADFWTMLDLAPEVAVGILKMLASRLSTIKSQGKDFIVPNSPSLSDEEFAEIYGQIKTIAVVGASDDEAKPSNRIPRYLQRQGYRIIPVNPRDEEVLGEKAYKSLEDIPEPVDAVDVFRPSDEAPGIARSAAHIGAKVLWLQTGITSKEAADIASDVGMKIVMDECMGATHKRLGLGR